MFDVRKFDERNAEAQRTLGELKNNGNITDEQYYAIKQSLDDVLYNLCPNSNYRTDGEVLARLTEDAVNSSGFDFFGYVSTLSERMHRYLQNEFWNNAIMPFIKGMGRKKDTNMDGRNIYACEKARRIVDNNPDDFKYVKVCTTFKRGYDGEDSEFADRPYDW